MFNTIVSFKLSPKSKKPRHTTKLNCLMSDDAAKAWILKNYPKACEFEFGTYRPEIKQGTSLIEGHGDWDGQPG